MSRGHSYNAGALSMTSEHLRSPPQATPGQYLVMDSKIPLKPVRVPEEASSPTKEFSPRLTSKFLSDAPTERMEKAGPPPADHLQVLVAEDDPINSKIIKKRLEKLDHDVYLTVNGEECASAYGEKPASFDVVLMDMQVGNNFPS